MIIAGYRRARRVNVNLWRMFLYITLITLLSSLCVNFIFRWLAASSQQQKQLQQEPPHGQDSYRQLGVRVSGVSSSTSLPSTSSASSSSLPCDEECLRFGRMLDAWPADKPKAAVVLLLRPSSIDTFARSSRLFNANFNDAYDYPVIVFHEENMNNATVRHRLRSLTNSSLYFQVRCRSCRRVE